MHVGFFGLPFAGHVNPTLGVVSELVARGHRVTYALPSVLTQRVAAAGARAVGYQTTLGDFGGPVAANDDPERYTSESLARVLRALLNETVASLPPLARAFADDRPDVVVHDAPSSWAGRLLARRWRVPAMRSRPVFAANEHWSLEAGYTDFTADPDLRTVVTGVDRLLRRLAVDLSVEEFFRDDEDEPTLVYLPRAFQFAGDTFGGRTHFVGPCVATRGFTGAGTGATGWRPPAGDQPVLLISLGTVYNRQPDLFRTIFAAIADLPVHGVVALGAGVERAGFGAVPGNVEIHAMVPQLDVLRHARLCVSHAGMTTTMESLAFGVPVLAIPQMAEHHATADRIVELGLGRRLTRAEANEESIRAAMSTLLTDDGTRQRAAAMRAEIEAAGGGPAAADAIEALVDNPHHTTATERVSLT
jgi:demethyllactenocin mycarosyltransferase